MFKSVLIVGIGGFIGSVLRYLVSRWFQSGAPGLFPWASFTVNMIGCLVIGIVYGISEKGNLLTPGMRLFLAVGICGGFTTFSSFSNDAYLLVQDREWLRVSLFAALSFFLGLIAIYLGRILAKLI